MTSNISAPIQKDIQRQVETALAEDIGDGDVTAALIPGGSIATARVISRELAVLSGSDWVSEVFQQLDPRVKIKWQATDGETISPDQTIFTLTGPARSLLTGERTALNFLQLLSGTATRCRSYADSVASTGVKLLDTRKTIPGLRTAQKYAVTCGGCYNHRMGLYDAFLIKENHIAACGSIEKAIQAARRSSPEKAVEIEVESLEELEQALSAHSDIIMLDNFKLETLYQAVEMTNGQAKLEASGNITSVTLHPIAETGVDYISIGALTKDCKAIDLSMKME
jgi:nicotinate-nucleotide pyrophosphorylase (carboxylating)